MSLVLSALGGEENRLISLRRWWHWHGGNRVEWMSDENGAAALDTRFTCDVAQKMGCF